MSYCLNSRKSSIVWPQVLFFEFVYRKGALQYNFLQCDKLNTFTKYLSWFNGHPKDASITLFDLSTKKIFLIKKQSIQPIKSSQLSKSESFDGV